MRLTIAIVCFIIGINFSNTVFFHENPLFGVPFLAEFLISGTMFVIGFFIIPRAFGRLKSWFEKLIVKTVSDIVARFWEQQNRRQQEARRNKQKSKKNHNRKKKQKEKKLKNKIHGGILLDTSVLVDGRILDIVKTGFLGARVIAPQFVLDELQLIADSEDSLKRSRGRKGLAVLETLKKKSKLILTDELDSPRAKDVDKKLVAVAKKYKLKIMTLDFNLNKVATVSGVRVLNINDLANAVKTPVLPGETMEVKIVQEGKEKQQGVGYLSDGTMVVVAKAKDLVGDKVSVEVTKILQGSAGKMIFGKMREKEART